MEQNKNKVAMPTDLKIKNRRKILSAFRKTAGRQVTLNEISDLTGISRQTIMKSMGFFLDMGIITNLGKGTSSELGGKRPELYQFHNGYRYVLCVRLGHRSLLVAMVNLQMEVVAKLSMEHNRNEGLEVIMEHFSMLYQKLLEETGISESQILGAGVCLSGVCNQSTGIMRYNSVYPSWGRDIPIVEVFRKALPEHFKVLITNETKLTAMAELYFDRTLSDKRAVVLLTHGGGISAAYVNYGRVVDGAHALAGEIGHMTVDPYSDKLCECGLTGCLEKVVSEESLLEKLQQGALEHKDSVLIPFLQKGQYALGEVVKEMALAADAGDELALIVTDYMARFMSIGLKNILLNLDPDCLIIQGFHSNNGRAYSECIKKYFSCFKYFKEDVDMEIVYDSRDINELAVLGTGYTLLEKYFAQDELYL